MVFFGDPELWGFQRMRVCRAVAMPGRHAKKHQKTPLLVCCKRTSMTLMPGFQRKSVSPTRAKHQLSSSTIIKLSIIFGSMLGSPCFRKLPYLDLSWFLKEGFIFKKFANPRACPKDVSFPWIKAGQPLGS